MAGLYVYLAGHTRCERSREDRSGHVPGHSQLRFLADVRSELAAQSGAESTRGLVARYGRARSLGERTRGHPDAGATSIALIFNGFKEGVTDAGS